MQRRHYLARMGGALAALSLGLPARAAWPERPITLIVPWGAGGGTDAVARIIGIELEKDLKQPVNVVNRTGGSGVVGHQAIASAGPDGYTIGILTVEIGMMRHVGLTQLSGADYTPLALMNFDPNAVLVRADSPIKTAADLLAAAKANPGKLKASGTGQGGIWHLGLARWLVDNKLPGNAIGWVPSNGAAPGLQDLLAGGVDVVSCSLPEARALIEGNKVRPLVLMGTKPDGIFPQVPLYTDASGQQWNAGAWRGIAGPKGLPKEVSDRLSASLKKIFDGAAYQDFLKSRGFGALYAGAPEFGKFMAEKDAESATVMKAVGIAK
ncbi:tripartite tricarboxylate transporter substrate binding protein [Pseudorhodoferax sp. Leaf267]|uniref:Bug family tripartite tricarboxylate transporter substrate binding protein n=1 Tax=Pseudorhodoferax sp. Leaf267 TaxID=1736316 RepID=UPI0006FC021E|nr:tripartite tricarboxylate transporter substrate binding protein [Pseudorhodoferax sp. Leaf267]KQP13094.1 ABC transporter substrate-binding protein [Pseudorhodoferax sp. Leaf267]